MVNSASYFLLLVIQDVKQRLLVIVLVGKLLKAKGSGDIISFELKLIFCSCSVVLFFFSNSFRKNLSIFFCTFDTSFQLFVYDYTHVFVSVYFLYTSIISVRAQSGYSVKDDLLFYRDVSIARENICYCHIFPLDKFFD